MIPTWIRGLTVVAAIGSGLVAGTFFAFSTFVMSALRRLPPPQGIAAMQAINVAVLNPMFMGVFMGTAALGLGLGIYGLTHREASGAGWIVVAALLYSLGTFLVTIVANVPLNDALAAVKPEAGTELWARYLDRWTLWNHFRALAATGATVAFLLGLMRWTDPR